MGRWLFVVSSAVCVVEPFGPSTQHQRTIRNSRYLRLFELSNQSEWTTLLGPKDGVVFHFGGGNRITFVKQKIGTTLIRPAHCCLLVKDALR